MKLVELKKNQDKIGKFTVSKINLDELKDCDIIRISPDELSDRFTLNKVYIQFGKFSKVSDFIINDYYDEGEKGYIDMLKNDPPFLKTDNDELAKRIYY